VRLGVRVPHDERGEQRRGVVVDVDNDRIGRLYVGVLVHLRVPGVAYDVHVGAVLHVDDGQLGLRVREYVDRRLSGPPVPDDDHALPLSELQG